VTDHPQHLPPSDVCLLLRSHAEQRWLGREVVPLVRELEDGDPPGEEELGIALAYLEVVWIEAFQRAIETEAAAALLDAPGAPEGTLCHKARAHHAAVRALRDRLADHVARLIAEADLDLTGEPIADALSHQAARHEADCIRSGRWRPGLTSSRIRRTPTVR
jgi:hypothetical protein